MEPLYYPSHPNYGNDTSRMTTIELLDGESGFCHRVDIYSPAALTERELPLLIGPHPITWTAGQDYHLGLPGLNRGYHRGYFGLAEKYQILIALPHGHHRRVENSSLAYPAQIKFLARLPEHLASAGFRLDRRRIYACGLSMGGQEALAFAGCCPELVAAVAAFNPIVDLAAWQEDMHKSQLPEIAEFGTARNIATEVGGRPAEVPDSYWERSPLAYSAGLTQVPALIFWSEKDIIVPGQESRHVGQLARLVRQHNPFSPLVTYNHTQIHHIRDFSTRVCWMLHEWCDYEWAVQWLLQHQKGELDHGQSPPA